MKYLVDTNIVIAIALDDDERVMGRVAQCDEGDMMMSAISLAEVTHGFMRGKRPALDRIEVLIDEIGVVAFDERAAREYAALPIKRHSCDLLIAAHALSLGLTLVTRNTADFVDVPGLNVENWAA